MNSFLVSWLLWLSTGIAAVNLIQGWLLKKAPNKFNQVLMLILELALLVLAVLIVTDLIAGQSSKANVFEFLGYLLGVLILPIAALFWALVEKNRFSTLILAGASLAVLVMVARMNQLWFG